MAVASWLNSAGDDGRPNGRHLLAHIPPALPLDAQ